MTLLSTIIEIIVNFIESIIGILFVGDMVKAKEKKIINCFFAAIFIMVGLYLINLYQLFSIYATVWGIFSISLCSYILYHKNIIDISIASCAYLVFLYVFDIVMISLITIFSGNKNFGKSFISGYSVQRSVIIIFAKITLVIIYVFFHKYFSSKLNIRIGKLIIGIMVCFASIYYLKSTIDLYYTPVEALTLGISSLLIFFLFIYIVYQGLKLKEQENQRYIIEHQNKKMREGYIEIQKIYQDNSIFYHDLKNKLLILQNFLQKEEYLKATQYINNLFQKSLVNEQQKWTGNSLIDFVLNYKKTIAESENIDFEIHTEIFQLNTEERDDICSLIGNLLDNAIEACRKEQEFRYIKIVLHKEKQMLFINTSNTCSKKPPEKNNMLISLKKERNLHGWGYKSINVIVERYYGTINHYFDNNTFFVKIALYGLKEIDNSSLII